MLARALRLNPTTLSPNISNVLIEYLCTKAAYIPRQSDVLYWSNIKVEQGWLHIKRLWGLLIRGVSSACRSILLLYIPSTKFRCDTTYLERLGNGPRHLLACGRWVGRDDGRDGEEKQKKWGGGDGGESIITARM